MALQAAARSGHVDVVKLLLFQGANFNAKSKSFSGRTALQAAAASGHINVVKPLLDNAADVNVAGPVGTALHAAAEAGYIDLVKMLLDNGAWTNQQLLHRIASSGPRRIS